MKGCELICCMNIDGDNFNQPSLRGLGYQAQSASESVMGKRSSFEKIYSYYLVPNQKEILIKQATIEWAVYPIQSKWLPVEQPRDLTILVFQ
jgi:hypothetical protein